MNRLPLAAAAHWLLGRAGWRMAQDAHLARNLAATCANCHGTNGQARGDMKPLAGVSADKIIAADGRLQERRPARDDHAPDRQGLHRRADQADRRAISPPSSPGSEEPRHEPNDSIELSRRRLLGAGAALGGLALAGCASTPVAARRSAAWSSSAAASAAPPRRATCKLWGGNVDVTLVERNASFVSCPISNLVLGGHKQMADITRGYDGLKAAGREGRAGRGDGHRRRRQEGAPGRRQRAALRPAGRCRPASTS